MGETRKNIKFIPEVYDRQEADFILDRTFTEFGQTGGVDLGKTVDQFFIDYEDLFYQIPIEGATGSHEYLVKKSSELYKVQDSLADIQPLLDEITLLRSQSVADQQTILNLKTTIANAGVTEKPIEEILEELKTDESD